MSVEMHQFDQLVMNWHGRSVHAQYAQQTFFSKYIMMQSLFCCLPRIENVIGTVYEVKLFCGGTSTKTFLQQQQI